MDQKAIAALYHQETKYREMEMGRHQKPLNWSEQPSPFKAYHSENKIDLCPYLPLRNNPFTGKPLAVVPDEEGYPFGLGVISRLLYFTNGVTGIMQYPSGESLFLRAAPTAGGLYPTEIYIAVRDLPMMSDGIYNFHVKDHSLVPLWEGNFWTAFQQYCLDHEAVGEANFLVILTTVYARSTWRYHERAYRRMLLDTGHVLGNLVAYAPEEGFVPYPLGCFVDTALNRLLFLDEQREGSLAVVALPRRKLGNLLKTCPALAGSSPLERRVNERRDALILQLHRGSSIKKAAPLQTFFKESEADTERLDRKFYSKEEVPLSGKALEWERGVGPTILRRRSTRAFSGEGFTKDDLAAMMEYAYSSLSHHPGTLFEPALIETYIVVQRVEGLESGVYYFAPLSRSLRRIYAGDFRSQCWHFCLGQELARDAAALVIHTAHLGEALKQHGDRAYRYLHLDAGYLGQRMNLAAIRLGLGVSGIGGFYDDEVNALLGLSLEKIIVYITTLGQAYVASS